MKHEAKPIRFIHLKIVEKENKDFLVYFITNQTNSLLEDHQNELIIDHINKIEPLFRKNMSFLFLPKDYAYSIFKRKEIKRLNNFALAVTNRRIPHSYLRILENFTTDQVSPFLKSIVDGKFVPQYISEDDPGNQSNATLKKATANTLEKIIKDPHVNTFLIVGAPWCGHCKSLDTKIQPLSEDLINKTIHFYKLDATLNDFPDGIPPINSYPTLLFWPKK